MCGFVRRRFDAVSNQWTSDWGEEECRDSMSFICAVGDPAVVDKAYMEQFDHCHPYQYVVTPLKTSAAKAQAIATLLGVVVPMIGLV